MWYNNRKENNSRIRNEYESVALTGKSTGEMAENNKELSEIFFLFFVNILVRMKVESRCRLFMNLPAM
jgi:hypothetical protein